MSLTTIPTWYRFFFLYVDPICSVCGAYVNLFTPAAIMAAYNPQAVYTRTQDVLFQQLAGPYLMVAYLSFFLLRYTQDLKVWRIYQTSVLLVDVIMLYSLYDTLNMQGRLALEQWKLADHTLIGMLVLAAVTRSAFITGIGLSKGRAERKRV